MIPGVMPKKRSIAIFKSYPPLNENLDKFYNGKLYIEDVGLSNY